MYRNGGNIMDYYEINTDTLCVLPIDEKSSFIYEKEDNFIVNMACVDIIKRSCLFFGSSFDGRKNASGNLLNANYKLPIVIEESNQLIFFPTNSIKNAKCIWISYNNFEGVDKIDNHFSRIYFKNNNKIEIEVASNIIINQIIRSNRLKVEFNKRKKAV